MVLTSVSIRITGGAHKTQLWVPPPPLTPSFQFRRSGVGTLQVCICKQFPGNADAAGPRITPYVENQGPSQYCLSLYVSKAGNGEK